MPRRSLARLSLILSVLLLFTPFASAEGPSPAAELQSPQPPGYLLACGAINSGYFSTVSVDPVEILTCQINIPLSGYALIVANAGTDVADETKTTYGALNIKIDGTLNTDAERQVSNGPNANGGTDRVAVLSYATWITAGPHTIRLMARFISGTTGFRLLDPTLSVIYLPNAGPVQMTHLQAGIDTQLTSSDPVTV
ncbi:MAG: hypothetical protein ACYC6L_02100, partial [Anaerolineae bacterium]